MNGTTKFYWKILLARLPAMALLFLVCTGLGLVLAVRLPTTYETSARLLVEAPQIDPSLAASTVRISGSEEIEIIRQQLLTRANLLDTAREFNVFAPSENLTPDEMVSAMREASRISARGGRQPLIVEVSFEARSGRIAANVVNEYVTQITAANVRNRTGVAENTLDFFEQEVARLSSELETRSTEITAFQRENAGALPDGQNFRLSRQSLLQERLASLAREIDGLERQRAQLVELFEATGSISTSSGGSRRSPEERRLDALENELAEALTVYSQTNPRVVQLQARVDRAKAAITSSLPTTEEGDVSPQEALYQIQLSEIDSRIEELKSRIPAIDAELDRLQVAIERTPLNTITLQGLQRDYGNIRQQYDGAVSRLSQASVGERIEVTSRGQRITLIEAANVPSSPASPNRPLVAMGGVAAGLGLAAGLFLLLELLNSTVRRPIDIQKGLGIVPLSAIPYIESRARRLWRRSGQVLAMLIVLIGVPAGLWAVDTYYLPLDLLAGRVLDKIGLG